MSQPPLKDIIEAALVAAGEPLTISRIAGLFAEDEQPDTATIKAALEALAEDYADRAVELRQVASGYRFQVRQTFAPWISRLWEERPARYSRALMETLALMAYRQPITRGEIEEVRGVAVSTNIIRTLMEREWVRVVGHREGPGRPARYGTTRNFLDYFNMQSLDELPTLAELRDLDKVHEELELALETPANDSEQVPAEDTGDNARIIAVAGGDVSVSEESGEELDLALAETEFAGADAELPETTH